MAAPSYDPTTSTSLIFRAKNNDPAAWEELCEIYAPLIDSWAQRAGLQAEDRGDIVQEVFRILAANLKKVRLDRPGDKFRAWLWTVARNELRRWFRKNEKERGCGGTDAQNLLNVTPDWIENDSELADVDPEDNAETLLLRRAANLAKGDFDEKTWDAFWRVTVEGHAAVDVAKDLGMTPGAVRQAKFRVLLRLREMLG